MKSRSTLILALCALFLVYAGVVNPVATARDALSAATAIASVVVLIVSAGVIADDRERGRLALAGTHPVPPAVWVLGRWLAVLGLAAIALGVASTTATSTLTATTTASRTRPRICTRR